jgi:SAM-dependent methyltransferase
MPGSDMDARSFDDLADVYDALIDWPKRLANEEPFYRALFERTGVHNVLDVACGTGRHAAMFHSWGCRVTGADISPGMIERCRGQFGESDGLHWIVRGFEEPATPAAFDAVVCIGNSLALAPDLAGVGRAVQQMLAAVRPGGVCVVQVLNLWHLPEGPCVWQKCRRVTIGGREHILVKGVHRAGSRGFVDLIDLNVAADAVTPRFDSPTFLGLEADELTRVAEHAGARAVQCYGGFHSEAHRRAESPDLIVVAER